MEIGPGKGEFLLWLSPQHPQKQLIAIEIKNGRFCKISEKIKTLGLANTIMVKGDARECLAELFKPDCLSEIYILFPDPWPKRRHHKHRLLKEELVSQLYTFLKPGGAVWVATDHDDYSKQIQSVFPSEHWAYQPGQSLYPTYFETKWKKLGKEIHYFCFNKKSS